MGKFKAQGKRLIYMCECVDPGCPEHRGAARSLECLEPATTILYRIDMEDHTGTKMCRGCADDAHASGVFRE